MPLPLEERVRQLEKRICSLEKLVLGKFGIKVTEIVTGIPNQIAIFSEELIGKTVLYVDRNGLPLRILPPGAEAVPTTRQAKSVPDSGIILLDPSSPTTDDIEIFMVIYIQTK